MITALLLAAGLTLAPASDNGKTVVVGYYSEPGLMNGASEGAVKSGYAYEYLQEMASHAGWRFKYVYGTFKELYDRLRAGEIDMLPYITRTAAREREVLFPDFEMGNERFYLAAKDGKPMDESLAALRGRKVGTNKAAFHLEPFAALLKEKGVECELVVSTNPHDRWQALMNGEIDFSIETSTVMQDVPLKAVLPFGGEYPYYLVVAPGRRDLLEELNRAQRLTMEIRPAFLHDLRGKYFRGIPLFRMLPAESVRWLERHRTIRIGSYDRQAPYIYLDKSGTAGGIMPDGVMKMLEGAGVTNPVEWKLYPGRDEALRALHAGEIDLLNPYYHNYADAERDGVIISAPVYNSNFGVLYRGDYDRDTLSAVATPGSRLGIRYMRDNYPAATRIGCRDGYECIDRLLKGEVNSVVMYLPTLQRIAWEYSENFNLKVLSTPCEVCFAALPGNAEIIGVINKALPYMSKGVLNEIENRHAIVEPTHVGLRQFFRQNAEWLYLVSVLPLLIVLTVGLLWVRSSREREKRRNAEQANRAKSEFLFNMSHDIRTPVHVITGCADIALEALKREDGKPEGADGDRFAVIEDSLGKIRKSGDLMVALLNSILDLGRIEVGKAKLVESVWDVRQSFGTLGLTMSEIAREKNLALSFEFGELRDRYVYADYEKVNRIFMNILTNAVKYTKPGGWIRVVCEQVGDASTYRYTFEDNGVGMSPEFVKRLYERFSREHNADMGDVAGIGLGMSICKAFVDLLGGTIECRSQQGVGTTFVVTLPFRLQEGEEKYYIDPDTGIRVRVGDEVAKAEAGMDFHGRRLLLVDDSRFNREVSKHYLVKAGFEVETADDGKVAVDLVRRNGPGYYDAVIMDIQMPGMGGYEATRLIRSLEAGRFGGPDAHDARPPAGRTAGPRIPIIALSANAFEEDRAVSLSAGMTDHVVKGAKIAQLLECLARHLNRREGKVKCP